MSRQISISYTKDNQITELNIHECFLFGHQSMSLEFWSLPILKEIGLQQLTVLGYADPIYFFGWEGLEDLDREITLLENNFDIINYDEETKKRWFRNLRSSLNRLIELSPKDSEPLFEIG